MKKKIRVMVVGLITDISHEVVGRLPRHIEVIDSSLADRDGKMMVGSKEIIFIAPESHERKLKELSPDVIIDFTSEFNLSFKDHISLYTALGIPFVTGLILTDNTEQNIESLVAGSESSSVIFKHTYEYNPDMQVELTINAIRFLMQNQVKGKVFDEDDVEQFAAC